MRRGLMGQAREIANETLAAMEQVAPLVAADALTLLGRIALAEDLKDEAMERFHGATLRLSSCGADRYAAECWFELGDLLQQVGDQAGAMDAYRRAAASTGLAVPNAALVRVQGELAN